MKFKDEHEKNIYMSGFFAGKNSVIKKPSYTKEELEEIESILHSYCDATIKNFSEEVEKAYEIPEWFKKIPGLKEYATRKEEEVKISRIIINFISYAQSKVIPEYLITINTKRSNVR